MLCQSCGWENPAAADFCNHCGAQLSAAPNSGAGARSAKKRAAEHAAPNNPPAHSLKKAQKANRAAQKPKTATVQPAPGALPAMAEVRPPVQVPAAAPPPPRLAPAPPLLPPEPVKKADKFKTFLLGLWAVLAVAALVFSLVFLVRWQTGAFDPPAEPPKPVQTSGQAPALAEGAVSHVNFFYDAADGTTRALFGASLSGYTLPGRVYEYKTTYANSPCAVKTSEGLYLATPETSVRIVGNCVDYAVAAESGAVAYLTYDDDLFLYDAETATARLVSGNVARGGFALSPDGETLMYTTGAEQNTMYLLADGIATHVAENLRPVAVSNGGKSIYAVGTNDNNVYACTAAGEKTLLAKGFAQDSFPISNRPHTELLFTAKNGVYIAQNSAAKLLFKGAAFRPLAYEANFAPGNHWDTPPLYNADTLAGHFYAASPQKYGEKSLYYVGEGFEPWKISDESYNYLVNDTGDKLFYQEGSRLFRADAYDLKTPRLIADRADSFDISPDGGTVYFSSYSNGIMMQTGNDLPVILSETRANEIRWLADGSLLFLGEYAEGGYELFQMRDGGAAMKVGDKVYTLCVWPGSTAYYLSQTPGDTGYAYALYLLGKTGFSNVGGSMEPLAF